MLHSKAHFDDVFKSKLLHESSIELGALELLEEEDENLSEAIWVIIRHGQVAFTFKAANVTLNQESGGERIVLEVVVRRDLWDECHASNFCVLVGFM